MKTFIKSAVATAIIAASSHTIAIGIGEQSLTSYLNEPLKLSLSLNGTKNLDPSQVKVSLADDFYYQESGLPKPVLADDIKFTVKQTSEGLVVEITSLASIQEPFLNLITKVDLPNGRLMKEVVVLLDPSTYIASSTQDIKNMTFNTASQSMPQVVAETCVTPEYENTLYTAQINQPVPIFTTSDSDMAELEPRPELSYTPELVIATVEQPLHSEYNAEPEMVMVMVSEDFAYHADSQTVEDLQLISDTSDTDGFQIFSTTTNYALIDALENNTGNYFSYESAESYGQEIIATADYEVPSYNSFNVNGGYFDTCGEYTIRRGDSLWNVTKQCLGDKVTNQRMMAIYNKNKSAFENGDINTMKVGATITLPTYSEVTALSAKEALVAFSDLAHLNEIVAPSVKNDVVVANIVTKVTHTANKDEVSKPSENAETAVQEEAVIVVKASPEQPTSPEKQEQQNPVDVAVVETKEELEPVTLVTTDAKNTLEAAVSETPKAKIKHREVVLSSFLKQKSK